VRIAILDLNATSRLREFADGLKGSVILGRTVLRAPARQPCPCLAPLSFEKRGVSVKPNAGDVNQNFLTCASRHKADHSHFTDPPTACCHHVAVLHCLSVC
jgi:hypothetical protein